MRLEFKPQAFEDLQFWVQTNPKLAKRLLRLIEKPRVIRLAASANRSPCAVSCQAGGRSESIKNIGLSIKWKAGD